MASGGRIEEAEGPVGLSFIVMRSSEMARARMVAHDVFIRDRTRIPVWVVSVVEPKRFQNIDVNRDGSQSVQKVLGKM